MQLLLEVTFLTALWQGSNPFFVIFWGGSPGASGVFFLGGGSEPPSENNEDSCNPGLSLGREVCFSKAQRIDKQNRSFRAGWKSKNYQKSSKSKKVVIFQNPDPPEAPAPEILYLESQNGIESSQNVKLRFSKDNRICPKSNSIAKKTKSLQKWTNSGQHQKMLFS